ncbi:cation-transporting P-type ATPase [Clostridium algidicarnis]|uniref:P-type ATPase n=1 Tax=Clostridium algidicarnis TaxID=37659 RepID=UPI001C0D647F|nr:cation-transporting P-type ATPase [Clostridium algidicarnis]MBU3226669.1 hypothetical protein [Clostridium algidicarnis]MBU3250420.1 hypothetical protein [Clostridium algidicarnis]
MNKFYNMTWSFVLETLKTDQYNGLSKEEIIKRRNAFGANILEMNEPLSIINLIMRKLLNVWVLYSLILTLVNVYFGEILISIIIFALLLFTLIFNIKIAYKNEKPLRKLQNLNNTICTVLRDKVISNISCKELVVGDIVILDKNFISPADIRLIESEDLKVRETLVTGEDYSAEKYETKIEEKNIPLSEMKNIIFKGSKIIKGSGRGVVTAIGEETEIGKTVKVLVYDRKEKQRLDDKVTRNVNLISLIFLVLTIVLFLLTLYKSKDMQASTYLINYLLLGFSPCSFLMAFNIYSIYIKDYWKKQDVYIKGISIFYLMNSIDMIFLDKVGAISQNNMYIKKIYTDGITYNISKENEINNIHLDRFLNIALLCNNGSYDFNTNTGTGDIIDQALIKYGNEFSLNKNVLLKEQRRIFEIPYDSDKRIQTSLNKIDNNFRANIKGAVDILLERCTHIMKNGIEKEITPEDIIEIKNADISISSKGLRTIGFAYRNFNYEPSVLENIESNLVLLGIAGFENPLKENINEEILSLKEKGIRIAIATEENKLTANDWGQDVKLIKSIEEIWSGIEMKYMDDIEVSKSINKIKIFSRISSEDKVNIVDKWNEGALKVLCAGENMTELPAMNKASVSIAVGSSSEAVKTLSDVYIKKDYISKLNKLINLSPKLLIQIKRALEYLFTSSLILIILLVLNFFKYEGFNIDQYGIIILVGIIIPVGTLKILISINRDIEFNKPDNISIRFLRSIIKSGLMGILIYGIYKMNLIFFNESSKQQIYLLATSYFIIKSFNGGTKYSLSKAMTRILFLVQGLGLFLIVSISTNYFNSYMQINDIILFVIFSIVCYLFTRQKPEL